MKKYYLKFLELIKNPVVQIIIITACSFFISFLYFGENLKAKMGIIDDHTYLRTGVLNDPLLIWKNFINAPEISSFGNSPRFRIIYDLINNIQTTLWGMDASSWYLVNIMVFAFFIFCVFYILYENLGIKWALPFFLLIISQKYFAHIFTRLGTAEVWTILGLSIYFLSLNSIYQKSKKTIALFSSWKECLFMILGAIIMIGSKENFATLGILVVAFILFLKQKNKLTKTIFFSSIFILSLNMYQVLHIFLTQRKNGVDFYQNDSGIIVRIMKIMEGAFSGKAFFPSIYFLFFILVLIAYLITEIKIRKNKIDKHILNKLFIRPFYIGMMLAVFYLFNLYIYNGLFYDSNRYAFPFVLICQILLLVFTRWVYDFWQYYIPKRKFKFLEIVYVCIILGLMFFLTKNIQYSRKISSLNVEATALFQEKIKEMAKIIKRNPKWPVVFSSYAPFDYEPLISVSYYLKYYVVENDLMVKTYYDSINLDKDPLLKWVAEENLKFEKDGWTNFVPYEENSRNQCFDINFKKEIIDDRCINLGKIWVLGTYPY